MIELVITVMIVGILAVAVVPRFFTASVFEARGFYDLALTTLRDAHKTAIAQRRAVYVNLNATNGQITLCYANTFPCSTAANQPYRPTGERPYVVTVPSDVSLSPSATFYFDALGRPYNSTDTVPTSTFTTLTITITGGETTRTLTLEKESGYVH